MLTVPPYKYEPGKGAPICDGPRIVATVNGTSYPLGSACAADYALARKMAAAPELLSAAKLLLDTMETPRTAKATGPWQALRATVDRAERAS